MSTSPPKSELSIYLQLANACCDEGMAKLPTAVKLLASLDKLYMDFIQDLGGIKSATAAILILNAHASFRASVGLAFSGQLLPAFMALRGCIESVLYANAMIVNPRLSDIWLKRGKSSKARQTCRDEFTLGKMLQYVITAQDTEFAARLRDAYDATIEFGAHPNSRSLVSSTQISTMDTGEHALEFAYIHGADSFELRQAVLAFCESGLTVFFLMLICHSSHHNTENLNKLALEFQDELPTLIESLGFRANTQKAHPA